MHYGKSNKPNWKPVKPEFLVKRARRNSRRTGIYTRQSVMYFYPINNDRSNSALDASIDRVSKEIIELKNAVRQEKTLKMYKQEYETLAKLVNQYPSQKETLWSE